MSEANPLETELSSYLSARRADGTSDIWSTLDALELDTELLSRGVQHAQRRAMIKPGSEPRVHAFIGGILRDLGCTVIAINGMPDHVHLLARYPARLAHADMLRHVKSRSSAWIRETLPLMKDFAWQEGYGGVTVSKSAVDTVAEYIRRQKEHHGRLSFEQEFLELLQRHGVEFRESEVFE